MADEPPSFDEPPARKPGRSDPTGRPSGSSTGGSARPEPLNDQQARAGRALFAEISPRHVRVTPGEVETATVTVRNTGDVVDEVYLSIEGDAVAWVRVAPDTLNIYPGTEAQATLRFAPARAPRPAAGLFELSITVSSRSQPESSMVYRASIEVAAFDNLTAQADGSTYLSGRAGANLPIKIRNLGNRPTSASIRASDMPAIVVSLSATSVPLEPGAETTVWAAIRVRSQSVSAQQYPFTIVVSGDYAPPMTIDGRFEPTADAPKRRGGRWLLGLVAASTLAIAAGIAVVGANLLSGHPTPTTTPPGSSFFAFPPIGTTPSAPGSADNQPTPTKRGGKTKPPTSEAPPPTVTDQPTPTPLWPQFAADQVWVLDSNSVDPLLKGTLYVQPDGFRAFWLFQRAEDGIAVVACEGNTDGLGTRLTPDIHNQSWPAESGRDDNVVKPQLCDWDPLSATAGSFAVTATGEFGSAEDRLTFTGSRGQTMTWRPQGGGVFCAIEGETCLFSGTQTIAFGINGKWAPDGSFTDSALCQNSNFGGGTDPIVGTVKICVYNAGENPLFR